MLKGTSYYNPVLNPERALRRRNVVLAQMVKRGVLSQTDFDRLKIRPIRLDFERQPEAIGPAPHLAAQIRKWLIDWADRNDHNIYSDGLIVLHHHRLAFAGGCQSSRAAARWRPCRRSPTSSGE